VINLKNVKKIVLYVITYFIIFSTIPIVSIADVGSFDSYDSSWGDSWSSSWDSSWSDDWSDSWDSSWSDSWDSDDSLTTGSNGGRKVYVWGTTFGNKVSYAILAIVIPLIVSFVIRIFIIPKIKRAVKYAETKDDRDRVRNANRVHDEMVIDPEIYQGPIVERIKVIDELFDKDKFNEETMQLFLKMQYAWTQRDWETIREFETEELYQQHKIQIEGYIKNGTVNILDNINVHYSKIYSFNQKGDKEVISAVVKVTMSDYIIDENTEKVLRGNKEQIKEKFYKLEFIRRAGVKTRQEDSGLNINNCPNCGAPIKINKIGECDYCSSTIINGDFGWRLNNYEPFEVNNYNN